MLPVEMTNLAMPIATSPLMRPSSRSACNAALSPSSSSWRSMMRLVNDIFFLAWL